MKLVVNNTIRISDIQLFSTGMKYQRNMLDRWQHREDGAYECIKKLWKDSKSPVPLARRKGARKLSEVLGPSGEVHTRVTLGTSSAVIWYLSGWGNYERVNLLRIHGLLGIGSLEA